MARPSVLASITISQLEELLDMRQNRLKAASRQRQKLQQQLDKLDAEIAKLSGRGGSVNGRGRRRNEMSLVATLEAVLADGKPKNVGEIVQAVEKRGYRSNSANFRAIVNQTLIKEKRFTSPGRGSYQLKK